MNKFFTKEHIFLKENAHTRDEALALVSEKAAELDLGAEDKVYQAFKDREDKASTGMLDGIAMPHAISDSIKHAAIIYISLDSKIADWETFDDSEVDKIIAMLVPKDGEQEHLQIISNFAASLVDDEKRQNLDSLDNVDEIFEFLDVNEMEE